MHLPPTRRLTTASAVLAMLLVWSLGSDSAVAQSQGGPHTASAHGLDLTVDYNWVDGPGYQPVRVTITPKTPPAADRTINIEFMLRRNAGSTSPDMTVEKDIELPAGSGPVSTTLSVPQVVDPRVVTIDIYDDGVHRPKLSMPDLYLNTIRNDWHEVVPRFCMLGTLGEDRPDFSRLAAALPMGRSGAPNSPTTGPFRTGIMLPAADLLENWIDYTVFDIFCLSLDELYDLKRLAPKKFDALTGWTAAGGNLWVYGVGTDWQNIGELEDVLELPPGVNDGRSDPAERGWTMPDGDLIAEEVTGYQGEYYRPGVPVETEDAAVEDVEEPGGEPEQPDKSEPGPPPAAFRLLEMGMVVALRSDQPFSKLSSEFHATQLKELAKNAAGLPPKKLKAERARIYAEKAEAEEMMAESERRDWVWLLNATGSNRWLWYQRHGVSMRRPNRDFYNFLIPGVGLAPIAEFLILITLFAAAIGPLNFWLLRRVRRIQLLVITVPILSATVTLLLVVYALVSDGLGTRVRVRSYTELDQRRGHAASFARLSYYAGLAPGDGLTFPDDVAMQPLDLVPIDHRGRRSFDRRVAWGDGKQHLTGGWLRSRTPTQLIALRSRPTEIGLRVFRADDGSGSWKVENRLATVIKQLAVRPDDADLIFSAENIADGETVTLNHDGGANAMWRAYLANQPALSESVNQNGYYTGIFNLSRNPLHRYYYYGSQELAPPTQLDSLLECSLRDVAAKPGQTPKRLEPRTYVAVVETSPEVVLGIESAEEQASFHVIRGEW